MYRYKKKYGSSLFFVLEGALFFDMVFSPFARCVCVGVCVCVCVIQDSHIRKYSEVFLHRFSHTGTPAASVIGLRRPPSAV